MLFSKSRCWLLLASADVIDSHAPPSALVCVCCCEKNLNFVVFIHVCLIHPLGGNLTLLTRIEHHTWKYRIGWRWLRAVMIGG